MTDFTEDHPGLRATVNALPIQEEPLDLTVSQTHGEVLGEVTIIPKGRVGWGISIERRTGLTAHQADFYDRWARERVYRFLLTEDPTIDGWHALADVPDLDVPGAEGWYAVAIASDLPDMSFLE